MYPSSNVLQPVYHRSSLNKHHSQSNTCNITKGNNHCTINPTLLHTMKLLSPTTTLILTSLLTTTTLANLSVEFEAPLPSSVGVGSSYEVKWTANQDYVSLLKTHERKAQTSPQQQ